MNIEDPLPEITWRILEPSDKFDRILEEEDEPILPAG